MKILLALLFAGCASVPQSECRRVALEAQHSGYLNGPNCIQYANLVTPLLRRAGATNIRWEVLDINKPKLHVVVAYDDAGRRWIVDQTSGPRHAVGDTVQEQAQRFASPWPDSTTLATLVAEVQP